MRFLRRLVHCLAVAAVASPLPAYASIIDPPAGERSLEYIEILFSSILGPMSAILNVGCLLFAGVIIGYTTLTGVLNTAAEGNVMGRSYSSMWVPLRVTLAIALLLPTQDGFSVMQLGVKWAAERGVGLAASTWTQALDYMGNNGTLYPPPIARQGEELATSALISAGCLEAVNRSNGSGTIFRDFDTLSTPTGTYRMNLRYTGTGLTQFDHYGDLGTGFDPSEPIWYPQNACGSISLDLQKPEDGSVAEPIKLALMSSIQTALAKLADDVYPVARGIINGGAADAQTLDGSELVRIGREYDDAVKAAILYAVDELADAHRDDIQWRDRAELWGWISAGSWYMNLMKLHQETMDFAAISTNYTPPLEELRGSHDFRYNTAKLAAYLENRQAINEEGESVHVADLGKGDGFGMTRLLQAGVASLADYEDPVIGLQKLGHGIINTVETGLAVAGAAKITAKAAESSFFAKFPVAGAIAGGVNATADMAWWGTVAVAGVLLPIAFMLAFYLPVMPFVLWMMGVAGWLVLMIEAIIAAPIWAVAHTLPDGEGFVGRHARAGYMICLSLFLRPTLMIFGLFASFFVAIIMGKLILFMFVPMMTAVTGDRWIGIVTILSFLMILTGLMISIAHRAYGLIHEIPDRILRYIGGMGEQLGESQSEHSSRSSFTAGAAVISRSAERASGRASYGRARGAENDSRQSSGLNGQLSPASPGGQITRA